MKSIVTIGGGTGQYTLLSGLKKYPVKLKAVVSMADDGGSTGVLRDELGVLPPGDVRQCLVAISDAEQIMRQLFNYRFEAGGLKGHSFGNIFLSTLEKITGSFEEAVRVAGMVLATQGEVMPVTTSSVKLVCGPNGELLGQRNIEISHMIEKETLRLEPPAYANPKACAAIENADLVVIGPGNLYCSIIPNLLAKGIPEAIGRSRAKVVYNCNLMTKRGHSDGYSVQDFVNEIERYIGKGRVDFVTYNNRIPEAELLERYAEEGQPVVMTDGDKTYVPLPADLVSTNIYVPTKGDTIKRTLIRHNPDMLASVIIQNCLGGV